MAIAVYWDVKQQTNKSSGSTLFAKRTSKAFQQMTKQMMFVVIGALWANKHIFIPFLIESFIQTTKPISPHVILI